MLTFNHDERKDCTKETRSWMLTLPFSSGERCQSGQDENKNHGDEVDDISAVQYAATDGAVVKIDSDFGDKDIQAARYLKLVSKEKLR